MLVSGIQQGYTYNYIHSLPDSDLLFSFNFIWMQFIHAHEHNCLFLTLCQSIGWICNPSVYSLIDGHLVVYRFLLLWPLPSYLHDMYGISPASLNLFFTISQAFLPSSIPWEKHCFTSLFLNMQFFLLYQALIQLGGLVNSCVLMLTTWLATPFGPWTERSQSSYHITSDGHHIEKRGFWETDTTYFNPVLLEKKEGLNIQYLSVQFRLVSQSDSLPPHGLLHTRPTCPSLTTRVY